MTKKRDADEPSVVPDKHEPADASTSAWTPALVGLGSRGFCASFPGIAFAHDLSLPSGPGVAHSLCICVDDFGLHAGINGAALQLLESGRVHAIGGMVGAPAWGDGVAPLRRTADVDVGVDRPDIGLHLDLTDYPLLWATPPKLEYWILASHLHLLNRHRLRAEIRAQLDTFEQSLGRPPAFIDGHRHVHQLPVVRAELLAELARRYGGFKPWLRSTRQPEAAARAGHPRIKPWLIEQLGGRGLRTLAQQRGYAQNRHLLGVYDFAGGTQAYARLLAGWVCDAADGDLLMCHPSLHLTPGDAVGAARFDEFCVLVSPYLGELLLATQTTLRSLSGIMARMARASTSV